MRRPCWRHDDAQWNCPAYGEGALGPRTCRDSGGSHCAHRVFNRTVGVGWRIDLSVLGLIPKQLGGLDVQTILSRWLGVTVDAALNAEHLGIMMPQPAGGP